MSLKTKTITLSSGWAIGGASGDEKDYRVERVTDSVEYTPGQRLHQNEVHNLCAHSRWKVTVIPSRGSRA